MIAYEFYWHDPRRGTQLIGVLPERRKSPTRITKKSVLYWGEKYFGNNLNPKEMFFIETEINGDRIQFL
jgi:hypothetical protein